MSHNSKEIYLNGTRYPSMRSAAIANGRQAKVVKLAAHRAISVGNMRDGIPDVKVGEHGVTTQIYILTPDGAKLCNSMAAASRVSGVGVDMISRNIRAGKVEFSIYGVAFMVAA